jgi:cellulose synthase operon protein C
MILQFPNLDTFRLALSAGIIPAEVATASATFASEPSGITTVEFEGKLPKKSGGELSRLGITTVKRHIAEHHKVTTWLQILPVTRETTTPQLSAQAPVLFELESTEDLPTIVGEMLRLGNDRQMLRQITHADGRERVLLRVVGPPYYTLLRAIDQTASGTKGSVLAYTEIAPRVWVQLGYTHPYAKQIQLPDDQMVFLRPARDWHYVAEGPFRDVYEILSFQLPAPPVDWAEAESRAKLTVPLKLVAGNAADQPELWVLRGAAIEQLDAFVREADDRITQRLKFAVAEDASGNSIIVLRVTASKLAPPVLPLTDVVGYKPYFKMPNLFIPVGTRLHPTLRRDAVRKLLADDTDQLVWLAPTEAGQFTPETLAEDSFRPLEEWVDYIIEKNHVPLQAWMDATRFDFDVFLCSEGQQPKPKAPDDKDPKPKRRGKTETDDSPLTPITGGKGSGKKTDGDELNTTTSYAMPVAEVKPPSEWLLRRQALEKEFLDVDGPLDDATRLQLWPELAQANAGYGDTPEAALCWINSLWAEPNLSQPRLEAWLRTEEPNLSRTVSANDFDAAMKPQDPTSSEVRRLAVMFLTVANQQPLAPWLRERLTGVQKYLESHETKLPIRAAWFVTTQFAKLTGADTLGVARARDRILQRLLEEGMRPERDIPFFLRSAGLKDSERIRQVREKAIELHETIRTWATKSLEFAAKKGQSDQNATLGYIEMFFAFGLAKLGESGMAKQLSESGRFVLEGFKPTEDRGVASRFLFKALQYRVDQAVQGKPHAGPLSAELLEELDDIHSKGKVKGITDNNNPFGIGHYAAMRMREQSLILEPQEKLDPYHEFMRETDDLRKALSEMPKLKDPNVLAKQIRDLYRYGINNKSTADSKFLVLVNALPLGGRVGEQFTVELLGLVPETMRTVGAVANPPADLPEKQGKLLERGLLLAANFDRREIVQQLVDQFLDLMKSKVDDQRFKLVNVVAGRCLKSLRKLGLRDEIDRMLHRMQAVILKGETPAKIRDQYAAKPELWAKALQSLLNLAGGWLTYGMIDPATPILDMARNELLGKGFVLASKDFTPLAQAYVAAVGQGPADAGMTRILELFQLMEPNRVVNSYTTSKFYSRFHLNLVEEVVLAVVNDDFALGPAGRRWLDEDEFLIRKRIHADTRRLVNSSGL